MRNHFHFHPMRGCLTYVMNIRRRRTLGKRDGGKKGDGENQGVGKVRSSVLML